MTRETLDKRPSPLLHPSPTRQTPAEGIAEPAADLQRWVGNQGLQRLMNTGQVEIRPANTGQPTLQLQRRRRAPALRPFIAEQVQHVRDALSRDDFISQPTDTQPQGGAFHYLNGLSSTDLIETLRALGRANRARLIENIALTDRVFDRPRLESALRSSAWGADARGITGLEEMDEIRSSIVRIIRDVLGLFVGIPPQGASMAPAFARLAGRSRVFLIEVLRTLPTKHLQVLQMAINDAPATDRQMIGEVLADLIGSGTPMAASDVIDVEGLRGLDRTMADIYNTRGQFLAEQARTLNISTASAAGIMKVESGGQTFGETTNRPIARFENHVFWDRWGHERANQATYNQHFRFNRAGNRWEGHQWRRAATDPWQGFHGNQDNEWQVIEFAASLSDQETAYLCASFGAGQIMGFNHATVGFASATEMVSSFSTSERAQLGGIFTFIQNTRGLADAVRANNYEELARRYNGAGQVAVYGPRIRSAAEAYQRVTAGKLHVFTP